MLYLFLGCDPKRRDPANPHPAQRRPDEHAPATDAGGRRAAHHHPNLSTAATAANPSPGATAAGLPDAGPATRPGIVHLEPVTYNDLPSTTDLGSGNTAIGLFDLGSAGLPGIVDLRNKPRGSPLSSNSQSNLRHHINRSV